MPKRRLSFLSLFLLAPLAHAAPSLPAPLTLGSGWHLQAAPDIHDAPADISAVSYNTSAWREAVVPGTILTSLVHDGVYPEPLYGENNRPDRIPDSLARTPFWYRTVANIPAAYKGHRIWLQFDGINYSADVWVNGRQIGSISGAFIRGLFDVTSAVTSGKPAAIAVLITPQPHPGVPHEHTLANGMGRNGGITAIDGPTFLDTIGWDWMPAIRDRDSGIWQPVTLFATGSVRIEDPLVTTDLPLPRLDSADIAISATLENLTAKPQRGTLTGSFGNVKFSQSVTLDPNSKKRISLDPKTIAALHLRNPKLWWPNGYGPQNLYQLHLAFTQSSSLSDAQDVTFGIRKIAYAAASSDNLTISVNGVPIFIRGGDWGMDEAMKRDTYARLDAKIHMHALAHMNMIRNWVGQSTSPALYELCDKYGILLWDEFFQPNPSDGPNPTDLPTYLANVRDKILRYRNHPSIAVWCARNEGFPPPEIEAALQKLMAELEPTRLYQSSSTEGRGVHSSGPYHWRTPREFYIYPNKEAFKTEIGSVSIPTLESIQGMMPQKDWESINDDWAEHDFARGAQSGDTYAGVLAARYGAILNLADFARKGQLANYEAFRAMYEGRNAKMFTITTGIITWMSNPAQPSFVWQLYHYDLEPNASLYAVQSASEPIHIQLNELTGHVQLVNNTPAAVPIARAHITLYNLDGSTALDRTLSTAAPASTVTDAGPIDLPANLSAVYFVRLQLTDDKSHLLSTNLYWRALPAHPDDLTPLNTLPTVKLDVQATRHDADGRLHLTVTVHNPAPTVALMAHLQLHRAQHGEMTGDRVLPVFYSANYLSLAPGETRTLTIDAALSDLHGDQPLLAVDGWNIDVTPITTPQISIQLNQNAQPSHWPTTYLGITSASAR